jgi:hypothetical protein
MAPADFSTITQSAVWRVYWLLQVTVAMVSTTKSTQYYGEVNQRALLRTSLVSLGSGCVS